MTPGLEREGGGGGDGGHRVGAEGRERGGGVSGADPAGAGQRTALVTGSTRGIGLAIAMRLAADGYKVALNYRADGSAARRALERVLAIAGTDRAIAQRADIATPDGASALVDEALRAFGRLDVLVNNAGPMIEASASETSLEEWQAMFDANLNGPFAVTRRALPSLRSARGNIVNIGSLNVELARGADSHAAYNAAKTALVVLTRSLARSEGAHGVRANVVSPGIIAGSGLGAEREAAYARRIPLGRLGSPEEVADAVAYLASDRAAYISGAVLTVAGGLWV